MTGTIEDHVVATRPQLTEFSDTAVAPHRERFGRGPGAAKTHIADDIVVCVLTDVFTPLERTLIDAGQEGRMEAVIVHPVVAHMSTTHVDPDLAVDLFLLGDGVGADPASDGAA